MKRHVIGLCAILMVCGLFCAAASAAEEIDNPMYQTWAQFKPGSFVTYKSVTKMGDMTTESKMTFKLKEVTSEKVVIELEMVMIAAGEEMKMPAQTTEHPAKIAKPEPEAEAAETPEPKKLDEGSEEVTVKDKKIKTTWVKTEFKQGDMTIISTVWTSEDVPNQTVKMVSEVEGPMPSTTEMTLIDFEANKE